MSSTSSSSSSASGETYSLYSYEYYTTTADSSGTGISPKASAAERNGLRNDGSQASLGALPTAASAADRGSRRGETLASSVVDAGANPDGPDPADKAPEAAAGGFDAGQLLFQNAVATTMRRQRGTFLVRNAWDPKFATPSDEVLATGHWWLPLVAFLAAMLFATAVLCGSLAVFDFSSYRLGILQNKSYLLFFSPVCVTGFLTSLHAMALRMLHIKPVGPYGLVEYFGLPVIWVISHTLIYIALASVSGLFPFPMGTVIAAQPLIFMDLLVMRFRCSPAYKKHHWKYFFIVMVTLTFMTISMVVYSLFVGFPAWQPLLAITYTIMALPYQWVTRRLAEGIDPYHATSPLIVAVIFTSWYKLFLFTSDMTVGVFVLTSVLDVVSMLGGPLMKIISSSDRARRWVPARLSFALIDRDLAKNNREDWITDAMLDSLVVMSRVFTPMLFIATFVVIHRVMDDASTVFYLPESYNANFERMVLYLAILFVARSITAAAIYVISNRYYYDKFMLHYAAFRIASHPLAALAAVFWSIFLPVKLTMFLSNVNFQRLVFAETVWGFWDLGDYPANFTMTASDSMSMG